MSCPYIWSHCDFGESYHLSFISWESKFGKASCGLTGSFLRVTTLKPQFKWLSCQQSHHEDESS